MQPMLWQEITVRCFACIFAVTDPDPLAAHDRMEAHYETAHRLLIDALTGVRPSR